MTNYPSNPLNYQTPTPPNLPTYLTQSILVTLFCCVPFGIVAIVYAAQVNSKLQAGDFAGAADASAKAKMWCCWSVGIGIVVIAISIFAQLVARH